MTQRSIREYSEAIRERYLGGLRKEKGKILNEFTKVTVYDRKSAIRLLHRANKLRASINVDFPESTAHPWLGHLGLCGRLLTAYARSGLSPFA